MRTVAERIADGLATAIVNGELRSGERVREVEVAALYGASRAPVREAIRDLAQRGLVRFQPRRGAYVVDISLDTLADVFNIRAALMGLAARMVATGGGPEIKAELRRRIDALALLVEEDDPVRFAAASARVGRAVARGCASEPLVALLDQPVARHPADSLMPSARTCPAKPRNSSQSWMMPAIRGEAWPSP